MFRDDGDLLDAVSERECDFYVDFLISHAKGVSPRNLIGNSKEEKLSKLNHEIEILIRKNRAPKDVIYQMQSAFNETQLTSSDFKWFDRKEERLCNWAWCYLKRQTEQSHEDGPSNLPADSVDFSLLSEKAFKIERNNNFEKFNDVMTAFHDGEASLEQQLLIVDFLKNKWQEVIKDKTLIHWLDEENEKQWRWAWNYLSNITDRPLEKAWEPTNDLNTRAAIITTVDLADNEDRKALIIDKMKKAWSQKKFREKTEGKKPYTISMTTAIKRQLDILADERGMKINETIESLIREAYQSR